MSKKYVVLDLETTGHSVAKGDRMIQIGAVKLQDGKIVDRFVTFINPEQPISSFIQELTGISDEDVKDAPLFRDVASELLDFMNDCAFVAHNVQFDWGFLSNQLKMEGYVVPKTAIYDTVELSRILMPKEESYKLGMLAEQMGFTHDRPHQADSDAEATAMIFLHVLKKLKELPLLTLQQLLPLSKRYKSHIQIDIQDLITDKLKTGDTGEKDYDCFRGLALKHKPQEPEEEKIDQSAVDEARESFLQTGEALATAIHQYEHRKGQQQMIHSVYQAFSQNEHAMIEAGTGTGKSLAYLIPSAFYAYESKKPVVISTQTIPLQDQLLSRDVPLLRKILPFPIRFTLLKGRSHYLDLRKFELSLESNLDQSYDVILSKSQILIWLTETEFGDIEELNLPSGGRSLWYEIQSDAASDLGRYSPWFSRCFYHRARKRAQEAHVIITNHALLLTDLVHNQPLLPSYSHVVMDEAHHLEDTASERLGLKSDYLSFAFLLQRLGDTSDEGILYKMASLAKKAGHESTKWAECAEELAEAKDELDELFRMIHAYALQAKKRASSDTGRARYAYKAFEETGELWSAIIECAMRVHASLSGVCLQLASLIAPMDDGQVDLVYRERAVWADGSRMIASLLEEDDHLYELLLEYDENQVYWIEAEPKGAKNATFLYSKPIDVSERLADDFFGRKKSVILTSATLTVNGSFDYQKNKLGLQDFGVLTSLIESPFSYLEQAKVLIPSDLPAIKDVSDQEFAVEVAIKIWRIAEVSKGKLMVLFTSYEMLRQVYQYVKDFNEHEMFQLVGQGITSGSRAKLMKMFKQSEYGMLFGTSSFWEGIDLPGDELKHLIIVRLPFSPPDEPLLKAQLDQAKELGKNPFMEVSLPQAIIRFKQGFGRLIRTQQDTGCVFVFDRRISTTRYGSLFIKSLPNVPVHEGKLEDLLEEHLSFL
ncbi:ATP-dependent DNA helicase DinG [Alkalicoccobacillus murimartini]|uniref:3'-5' exonuclease DinG n=1 Tax=Alkalicoccobacillus murimartini TaxID=171685 RepID=A0ABT9YDN2_9BACI|nr:ATP-dependent DNA helicase DinG [Alkalicoccobacillus murimartini]MDQ0205953.1 ATP-dependent DNA helicase DinG [Alkalicoccobacillus murimartini]